MKCDVCGAPVEDGKCTYCGKTFPISTGNGILQDPNQSSLNNENNNQLSDRNVDSSKKEKDKTVALLLCIFLGYFGAHKFYEGKIGVGFLYLFTVGIFGIGWIVDIIIILMKPKKYFV